MSSDDRAHLSRDIVPLFWAAGGSAGRLVVAGGIEGEFAEEPPVFIDHADVSAGHEQGDASPDVIPADPDVVEPAQVTNGHASCLVHCVVAKA
jgi:hypothetical protein